MKSCCAHPRICVNKIKSEKHHSALFRKCGDKPEIYKKSNITSKSEWVISQIPIDTTIHSVSVYTQLFLINLKWYATYARTHIHSVVNWVTNFARARPSTLWCSSSFILFRFVLFYFVIFISDEWLFALFSLLYKPTFTNKYKYRVIISSNCAVFFPRPSSMS